MPRDGLQQYAPPPGTNGITNYTIESTKYNGFVADVTQDLNLPRPIVAGGTGANNAHDAMIALSGEITKQNVDNYDSFPFVAGSFWSNNATSSPVAGQAFAGICYVYGDPSYMVLEARNLTDATNPGKLWVRQKTAGVWSSWVQQAGSTADLDAAYVNVAGDTMTGGLSITSGIMTVLAKGNNFGGVGTINSDITPPTQADANIIFYNGGGSNWAGFGADGNGAMFFRTGVSGTPLPSLILHNDQTIKCTSTTASTSPTTGALTVAGGVGVNGGLTTGQGLAVQGTSFPTSGVGLEILYSVGAGRIQVYDRTNSVFKPLQIDGSPVVVANTTASTSQVTGALTVGGGLGVAGSIFAGDLFAVRSPTTGYLFLGSNSTKYLGHDGSKYQFAAIGGAGGVNIQDTTAASSLITGALTVGGGVGINGGVFATGHGMRAGVSGAGAGGLGGQYFNIQYDASALSKLWVDNSNVGTFAFTSDYRIKKDVIDLPGMWDTVKALRPIKYTQAQFSPPSHVKYVAEQALAARKEAEENPEAKPREVNTGPLFVADDIERWGFIAHELQATLTPSAASGEKDSPDTIQSPNPFTVIAALTKALQEAMVRIEALEAR